VAGVFSKKAPKSKPTGDLINKYGYRIKASLTFGAICMSLARAPIERKSVGTFPGTTFNGSLGHNPVSINNSIMEIDIPVAFNTWTYTKESRRMGVYAYSEELFRISTPDGDIPFRAQLWLVNYEPPTMFVKHQYEWGDGFAWIGGRPESNRRKF
jgi:hypothetical protein